METVKGIIFLIAVVGIPIAILVWAVDDLSRPPSAIKAFAKIALGSAIVLVMVADSPHGISFFLMGTGTVSALLGTADMAAIRNGQRKE